MLKIYTIKESSKWDQIVMSFPNYDIYYLSGYLKAFELHGDGNPILVYYEKSTLRGICTFMLRDISDMTWAKSLEKGQFMDVVTPYGYGGWLTDGDCSKKNLSIMWNEYVAFMKENRIINAFTRWCPWLQNQEMLRGFSNVIDLGSTIFIDTATVEGIMENIKSKDRSTIRKAVKNGITVDLSDKPELFEEFVDIYNATMTKDHADKYYFFGKKFYKSIINDLQGKWLLATARLENKVIAMSIILLCNGRMHYHLSGSVLEYRRLNATNLILYETAKYGAEHGYTIFHLGGGVGSGEDSLYNFKKSFNKHGVLQFSISKDIFDKEKYENLVALRIGKDNDFHKSSFFPEYRSICD